MAGEYQHKTLSSPRSIRLLHLFPSSRDSALECSLDEVSLDQAPDFHALSYVWGEPDVSGGTYLLCSGKRIVVTPNCAAALIHLRHEAGPRVLWIDAVCINQASLGEKNHQVPLMGDIYRKAVSTFMWLGESTPDSKQLLLRTMLFEMRDGVDTSDTSNNEDVPEILELVQALQSIDGNKST